MESVVNTGMSISDWSGLVAMVVALCSLLSPSLTAYFNNRHQQKMKEIEYAHQEKMEHQAYEREIYEGYIRAAGAAIQSASPENLKEYGSHSALVAYHVPENVRDDILKLDKQIRYSGLYDDKLEAKVDLLSKIVTELRTLK